MVYKNNYITSTQVKNTLKEAGASLSGSAYKSLLHQRKYKRFPARCKPLVTLTSRRATLRFARKYLKESEELWNEILWINEAGMGKEKFGEVNAYKKKNCNS